MAHRTPYAVGVVDLVEGARTAGVGLLADDPARVRAGAVVRVRFVASAGELVVPWFEVG